MIGVSMSTELASLSRPSLLKKAMGLVSREKRSTNAAEALGERMFKTLGTATAFGTAAALGYSEVRWAAKSGKPLAIGPIPVSLATSIALTGAAAFGFDPMGQVSAAAAGAAGAFAGQWGREAAMKAVGAKAARVQGLSFDTVEGHDYDEFNDAEAAL